jgi:hypothetical protein
MKLIRSETITDDLKIDLLEMFLFGFLVSWLEAVLSAVVR